MMVHLAMEHQVRVYIDVEFIVPVTWSLVLRYGWRSRYI